MSSWNTNKSNSFSSPGMYLGKDFIGGRIQLTTQQLGYGDGSTDCSNPGKGNLCPYIATLQKNFCPISPDFSNCYNYTCQDGNACANASCPGNTISIFDDTSKLTNMSSTISYECPSCNLHGCHASLTCVSNSTDTKYCAVFNGPLTCSLGYASGKVIGGKGENLNGWDTLATSPSNVAAGYANCIYSYDMSKYTKVNAQDAARWITDLVTATNNSTTPVLKMPSVFSNWVRDSMAIGLCGTDFYNDLYINTVSNAFKDVDIFSDFDQVKQAITNNYIPMNTQTYINLFDGGILPTNLGNAISNVLSLPKIFYDSTMGKFVILVYVSLPQYNYLSSLFNNDDLTNQLNQYLRFFLRDDKSSIEVNDTLIPVTPAKIRSFTTTAGVTGINLMNEYTIQDFSNVQSFLSSTDYFVGNYYYTCEVISFSPILYALFIQQNPNFEITDDIAQRIIKDTNLYPYTYFRSKCDLNKSWTNTDCPGYISKYCGVVYTPPDPFSSITLRNFFLMSRTDPECKCYNSLLTPAVIYGEGNRTAMCFDTYCNKPGLRTGFDLGDVECKAQCPEMYSWLNSTNPAIQPQNLDVLDNARYNSLCGVNYKPYYTPKVNKSYVVLFVILTILSGIVAFLCTKKSLPVKLIITGIAVLIVGGISAFLSFELAGTSSCDGNTTVCKSGVLKRKLPSQFCQNTQFCECPTGFNNECPSGCLCSSGLCIPKQGTRLYNTVPEHYTKIVPLTFGILLSVFVFGILFLLRLRYLNLSPRLNTVYNLSLLIIPLLISLTTVIISTGYTSKINLLPCNYNPTV